MIFPNAQAREESSLVFPDDLAVFSADIPLEIHLVDPIDLFDDAVVVFAWDSGKFAQLGGPDFKQRRHPLVPDSLDELLASLPAVNLGYDDQTVEDSAVGQVLGIFRVLWNGVYGGHRLAHFLQGLGDNEIFRREEISLLRLVAAHIEIKIIVYGVCSTFGHIRSNGLWRFCAGFCHRLFFQWANHRVVHGFGPGAKRADPGFLNLYIDRPRTLRRQSTRPPYTSLT